MTQSNYAMNYKRKYFFKFSKILDSFNLVNSKTEIYLHSLIAAFV